MSTIATNFKVGAAAAAIAATTAITPAVVNAQPATMPSMPTAPVTQVLDNVALSPVANLAQDVNWNWFYHRTNATRTARTATSAAAVGTLAATPIFTFEPLAYIPGFLRPFFGPILNSFNFSACFGGFGIKIGPYGRVTATVGGCN
jgi:hypothetical protein